MHITSKEVDKDGTHILTSLIEGDGAVAMVSPEGKIEARVISVSRTDSGGIQVQTAVTVTEPKAAEAPAPLSSKDQALAYLAGKGFDAADSEAALAKFGVERILARQAEELSKANADLDEQLANLLK